MSSPGQPGLVVLAHVIKASALFHRHVGSNLQNFCKPLTVKRGPSFEAKVPVRQSNLLLSSDLLHGSPVVGRLMQRMTWARVGPLSTQATRAESSKRSSQARSSLVQHHSTSNGFVSNHRKLSMLKMKLSLAWLAHRNPNVWAAGHVRGMAATLPGKGLRTSCTCQASAFEPCSV